MEVSNYTLNDLQMKISHTVQTLFITTKVYQKIYLKSLRHTNTQKLTERHKINHEIK